MKGLFVDTSGWMAMADAADPQHKGCCRARDECLRRGGVLISTDYVADETLTLLRFRLGLSAAASWWDQVEASSRLQWALIDAQRAEKSRTWFFRWADKDFSSTDCTSFVVMRDLHVRRALTTDKHFRLAGFEVAP